MSSISFCLAMQFLVHSSDVSVFALVDGLQYERFTGYELKIKQDVCLPLLDTWPDSRIAFAGPWLIRMNETMAMREQLEALDIALPGFTAFSGPACSGSFGDDAEQSAAPGNDRFNA